MAVPSGGASVRVAVVGELGGRRKRRRRWRRNGVAAAVCIAGTQGSTSGCGNVPQHFGSHFLPFCLPLLQKVRRGA